MKAVIKKSYRRRADAKELEKQELAEPLGNACMFLFVVFSELSLLVKGGVSCVMTGLCQLTSLDLLVKLPVFSAKPCWFRARHSVGSRHFPSTLQGVSSSAGVFRFVDRACRSCSGCFLEV